MSNLRMCLLAVVCIVGCGDGSAPIGVDANTIADARINDAAPVAGDSWISLADVGEGAVQEVAVAELGGLIYVLGGFDETLGIVADVQVYDPETDRWLANAPRLPAPVHHAHAVAIGDTLWVVGVLTGLDFRAVGVVWSFTPGSDSSWNETHAVMPGGTERGGGAAAVIDGVIYLAGGLRRGMVVADFSSYDPGTNSWNTTLPALPVARDHLVASVVGGVFYAIGGRDGSPIARVDAFDPLTGEWTQRQDMPIARAGCAAGVIADKIIVVGGEGSAVDADGVFPQTSSYDPATDQWKMLQPMKTPRHGMGAAVHNGRLYVPGGATKQGFGASGVSEAYVP